MSWSPESGAGAAPVNALFVYGSLRSEHPSHALVTPYVARIMMASTTGRLLAMAGGYPGLIEDEDNQLRVLGELLQLRNASAAFSLLDEYEGSEYRRVLRPVALTNGSERLAWCYLLTATAIRRGTPIPGGDWLAWTRRLI
jgi:gamma-glutamylcyclotransferase (GGCT)/AIG2-like uncharacterized protein YtfP